VIELDHPADPPRRAFHGASHGDEGIGVDVLDADLTLEAKEQIEPASASRIIR
jgi:hypothetical protein